MGTPTADGALVARPKALAVLTRMACPAPCVGYVNDTGWHKECERKALEALTILRGQPSPSGEQRPCPSCGHTCEQYVVPGGAELVCEDCGTRYPASDPRCVATCGIRTQDDNDGNCPINCHDTRPWCECMCHGTDDDDDEPSASADGGVRRG